MENQKVEVCGGIVLYNPEIRRLKENLDSLFSQVEKIILIDNGSLNRQEIIKLLDSYPEGKIQIEYLGENKGIAFALNRILLFAQKMGFPWFLTLDQDSVASLNLVSKYIEFLSPEIGQMSCNILDRNVGKIDAVVNYDGQIFTEVNYCITSGCLNNTDALLKVGGYNDLLFIDGVDLDISCNLRKHGYRIICLNFDGLVHELGHGEIRSFLGHHFVLSHHSPWRNYYSRRNIIYVAKKYFSGKDRRKMIRQQILYAFGSILFEDHKIKRLIYNFRGIRHGLHNKLSSKISTK
jgi:rhamnosyltransferase